MQHCNRSEYYKTLFSTGIYLAAIISRALPISPCLAISEGEARGTTVALAANCREPC